MPVADAVHAEIETIRKELPKGVELQPFYDQSDMVNDSIASVRDAIIIGLVLASLIMVLFLRDWGTSLVAGLVIPGDARDHLHRPAAARRELQPDDARRPRRRGRPGDRRCDRGGREHRAAPRRRPGPRARRSAARSREIRVPLIGSTITPIVVFLPLITITGVTGAFFRALAITVGMALLTSLALALTWTPTLSHYFLGSRHGEPRSAAVDDRHAGGVPPRLMRIYERTLRLGDRAAGAAGRRQRCSCWSRPYGCYRLLGSDLLPEMDEGGFILDYIMPAGSSLAETNRVLTDVEQILRARPKSRARRAAPACSSAWRRSPRRTPATSRSS